MDNNLTLFNCDKINAAIHLAWFECTNYITIVRTPNLVFYLYFVTIIPASSNVINALILSNYCMRNKVIFRRW